MPPGRWPNFLVGNHDYPRILTKMDVQFVNAINMLLLLLPGTPTTYYGEEIGMNDIAQPTPPQDPWGRDPERSPMQWSNASLASFSNCTGNYDPQKCPWLPVNQDYLAGVNVQAQEQDKDSSLNLYKSLAKLRQEPTFLHGKMKYAIVDDDIFSYVKDWPGETNYMVVINLSPTNTTHTLDLTPYIQTAEADIAETTRLDMDPSLVVGNSIVPASVLLKTGQGIVLKWKYSPVEIWHKDEA
ncbi:maltase 2-like [Lingula anatina]|uniref:Maltase 2-like n=1 Tax=Lingula anatina TaxID=7574 RepID=A0A1S3KCW0_LINAN|nr:maltase 2-like [Lingula anatina]|eukprot:XP_013420086.1 maltase 2-like [Lingula anatina]